MIFDIVIAHNGDEPLKDCVRIILLSSSSSSSSSFVVSQKGFNLRIKEIHLVNMPPFADVMLGLLKMVLKPKLISRVSKKKLPIVQ